VIAASTTVEADPDIVSCAFGEGLALLDLRTGSYFTINRAGAFVWDLISAPIAVKDITRTLLDRYDADEARCAADVEALLREMDGAKLIRLSDAPAC
jgi:hypothetical protein